MRKLLEEAYPQDPHYAALYDIPVFLEWWRDGVDEIAVQEQNYLTFVFFAVANNLASFKDHEIFVAGMKVVRPTHHV